MVQEDSVIYSTIYINVLYIKVLSKFKKKTPVEVAGKERRLKVMEMVKAASGIPVLV